MPSSPEFGRSADDPEEEIRRKEREREFFEAELERRRRMADRLLILRIVFVLVEAVTGNPIYRWAHRFIKWVIDLLRD
ncbi:hypothetical protein [Streptomyces sp. NPDC087300]|uniref:hypothetical protein n=1 Tax=Streptomyces sp. NPDC087300 TaxID=3365780 RepID=UPI00382DC053